MWKMNLLNFQNVNGRFESLPTSIYFQETMEGEPRKKQKTDNSSSDKSEKAPEGFLLVEDFISADEESKLIKEIDKQTWSTELKRRVQHYGFKYDYKSRGIDESMKIGSLPDFCEFVILRCLERKIIDVRPDQLIINEYTPGQGISAHIDHTKNFEDGIWALSLGSFCKMEFTHSASKQSFGPSRYDWKHSIPSRKSDEWKGMRLSRERRISLTFRKVVLKQK